MSAPDISREGLQRLCAVLTHNPDLRVRQAVAPILALRAALDAAERERDDKVQMYRMAESENTMLRETLNAADATGYARGVQDAAALCLSRAKANHHNGMPNGSMLNDAAAILALLPANKDKNDE